MDWPLHGRFLIPGINDTWNNFQKFSKGRTSAPCDWAKARKILYEEYEEFLVQGGIPIAACEESVRLKSISA
jgi:hypothetical protein